jgi:hypothetical protein
MGARSRVWISAVCLLCVWFGAESSMQTTTPVPRTKRVPDFDWGPYYARDLKNRDKSALGTTSSAVIVLGAAQCAACVESIEFYKSLMKLPGVDGVRRRVIVVARDGLNPVFGVIDAHGFKPHFMTSGPYPRRPIQGVTRVPTVIVLDAKGRERGKWEGILTSQQKQAVVLALTK